MFTFLVTVTLGFLVSSQTTGNTTWTNLRSTWSGLQINGFYQIPLSLADVQKAGWDSMLTCSNDARVGSLYSDEGDISTMPFYNQDGYLQGIILGMTNPGNSSEMSPFNKYMLQNGTVFWGIEANFRDPYLTCNSGNQPENVVGDRLWFRVGDNVFYEVPLTEDESELNSQGWEKGACFVEMGLHYWRYISVDMDCNDTYPIFLLYTDGKLTGWGIAMAHDDRPYLSSYRWEHPQGNALKYFFQPNEMPTCLPNQGVLSTQHIFMTNPYTILCL